MRARARVVVIVAAAALALSACSSMGGASRGDGEFSYVAGDGSTIIVPESQRKLAPPISAPTLAGGAFDGPTFNIQDQRGKVVVLNVWASWCAPCRAEAPALSRISAALQPDGVVFAGLNTRDTPIAAQSFVDRFGLDYPSLDDTDGKLQLAFRNSLPMLSVPTTVVIDKQGRVAARALGELDESLVRGLVEPLLRESS